MMVEEEEEIKGNGYLFERKKTKRN